MQLITEEYQDVHAEIMNNYIIILSLIFLIDYNNALKLCHNHTIIGELCRKETKYKPPIPVEISSILYLNAIHGIDEDSKSISIFFELLTEWSDNGIEINSIEE